VFVLGFRKWKPWLIFKLAFLMKRLDIRIVHTHLFASNMVGRLSAWLAGVPVIIAMMRNTTQMMTRLQMMIDRILEPVTTRITVIDKAVQGSVIRDEKIPPPKIICIHNAIDMAEFTLEQINAMPQRTELKVDRNKFLIGMIAGLSPIKGHSYLLQAMPMVLREIPKANLILVGDGPLRKEIEKEISNLDIAQNVTLLGSRQDIPALASIFDIVAHPSFTGAIPKSILEAMALKKAVVATTLSAYPDVIINGITAILVPPKDPVALARAIVKLYKEPQLRASIGQNACEVVKDYFNYPRMIKELEDLYDSLCK
jgi:glycosyltransferase involved in cell wall biosynthesis